jgi:hypothetical protein
MVVRRSVTGGLLTCIEEFSEPPSSWSSSINLPLQGKLSIYVGFYLKSSLLTGSMFGCLILRLPEI